MGYKRLSTTESGRSSKCRKDFVATVFSQNVDSPQHKWLAPVSSCLLAEDEPEDDDWSVRDQGTTDAPDQAIVVPYRQRFAFFSKIEDVLPELLSGPPEELDRRVSLQFPIPEVSA